MNDNVTVKITVNFKFDGTEYEEYVQYPRDKWQTMSSLKRQVRLNMMAEDAVLRVVETRAEVIE